MCRLSEMIVVEAVEGGAKVLSHPVYDSSNFRIKIPSVWRSGWYRVALNCLGRYGCCGGN